MHFVRGISVVVLIVKRKVAYLRLLESKIGRRKFDEGSGELCVKRVAAQAADDDSDFEAHVSILLQWDL